MTGIGAYQAPIDCCVLGLSYIKANGYEYAEDQRSGSEKIRGDGRMPTESLCVFDHPCKNYVSSFRNDESS